ncbi:MULTISPECIES: hypothetical protein [Rhizobium]|jgi:hypothetical protein|uniref:Uncharacterized protein n=1 Tax=Rhizobium lusitanum TaxID=293958 RepID=A0A1C3XJE2_9HYPH|nr:hypothetical protein [Rhizobium lusitanum]SCB52319.1 hypothetical protein GA0061101_14819 [Rhizobium lusitanum]
MKQVMLAVAFSCINVTSAIAQRQVPDEMQVKHKETRNMLGVLEFCKDRGISEDGALEFLQMSANIYDDLIGSSNGDEAEFTGRAGVISGRGMVKNIADIAIEQHRSVDDICRQLVGFYKRGADEFARQKAMSTDSSPSKVNK